MILSQVMPGEAGERGSLVLRTRSPLIYRFKPIFRYSSIVDIDLKFGIVIALKSFPSIRTYPFARPQSGLHNFLKSR